MTSVTGDRLTGHMRSLASATQTTSSVVSSSTVSAVDVSSPLTMSGKEGNFLKFFIRFFWSLNLAGESKSHRIMGESIELETWRPNFSFDFDIY